MDSSWATQVGGLMARALIIGVVIVAVIALGVGFLIGRVL